MECCPSNNHPRHINWFEICHRRHRPRAPNRMLDREHARTNLLRRKLVRNRITRMMFRVSKPFPELHIVKFEHHSVNIKIEIFLVVTRIKILSRFFFNNSEKFRKSFYMTKIKILSHKTPFIHEFHHFFVTLDSEFFRIVPFFKRRQRIREKFEISRTRHKRINLTK